jgi:hypothetical protein
MPEPEWLGKVNEKKDGGDGQYDQGAYGPDLANGFPLLLSQQGGHYRSGVETHVQTRDVKINGDQIPYGNNMGNVVD